MWRKRDLDVPRQYIGNKLNVEYSVIADSIKEAVEIFSNSVRRLLNVNEWQSISNSALSEFQLVDEAGNKLSREAHEDDLFKIKVPGLVAKAGEGYDWVQVEMIKTKPNRVSMRVHPVPSPIQLEKESAHFFRSEATGTFQVFRRGRIVTGGVYGRNEVLPADANYFTDKIRNAAIAMGAFAGASRVQWESLVKGILGTKQTLSNEFE